MGCIINIYILLLIINMDSKCNTSVNIDKDMFDYPSMVICVDAKDGKSNSRSNCSSRTGRNKKVSFYPYLERIYIESYKQYNLENSYNEDIIMAFSEEYIGRRDGKNGCGNGNENGCFSCVVI
jgi:hypothetical protein